MSATIRQVQGRTIAAVATLLLALACAAPSLGSAAAAPAPAAGFAGAHARLVSPPQFLPASDGQDDAAGVAVDGLSAVDAAQLQFDVVSIASGAVVRTIAPVAGSAQGWWDGTDAGGKVAPAGSYELRARIGQALVASTTPTQVRVLDARFLVDHLKVRRATVSAARTSQAQAAFRMVRRGTVQAVVVDADGGVVRTIASGRVRAGVSKVAWNGSLDSGAAAPDGRYRLLVAGTGGAMPSATLETPLLVDRHAPRLLPSRSGARATTAGATTISLRVTEPVRLVVRAVGSRRKVQLQVRGGRSVLHLTAAQLGLRTGGAPRKVALQIVAIDVAGNRTTARMTLAVAGAAPKAPPVAPPTHPAGSGGSDVSPGPGHSPIAPAPAEGTPGAHSLSWPAHGIITSPFGPRGAGFHYGIDIAAASGTPITAPASGLVSYAGTMDGYGNLVIVQHPGGVSTRYGHLSRIDVVVGQPVARGAAIGLMGCTGHCSGPHLHFEVRTDGTATNPIPWLPAGPPPAA